jgi:hypothetical protein
MIQMRHSLMLAAALALVPNAALQAQGSLGAEDMAEIHNLYAQYNLMLDRGDAEGWAFAENFHEGNPNSRHWNTNIHLTATSGGADGTCYLILYDVGQRPPGVTVTGIYSDVLVETADGWRFQSRQVAIDR